MSKRFPEITLRSNVTGATATGELVLESSDAYQVAVDGKVRLFRKNEWHPGFSLGSIFGI